MSHPENPRSINNEHSIYTFQREDISFTLSVPFSHEDMDAIAQAHQAVADKGSKIREGMALGSGFERWFFTEHSVPWGYTLRQREESLDRIQGIYHAAVEAVTRVAGGTLVLNAQVVTELETLQVLLQRFIPEDETGGEA